MKRESIGRHTLSESELESLREFDACTVSNAIERLDVRLRNEGYAGGAIQCRFPRLSPMLGYAVTGHIRSISPPIAGGWYYEHMEWWRYVLTIPEPRVIVMQDVDDGPGTGAWFGEIHAHICRALGCVGYVTNGAVRDLDAVEEMRFHLFSGSVVVSHAYAHVVDFGGTVEVGGLKVTPGDLLNGDRNGVHLIPAAAAARITRAARELRQQERKLIDFCRSPEFSLDKLGLKLKNQ